MNVQNIVNRTTVSKGNKNGGKEDGRKQKERFCRKID